MADNGERSQSDDPTVRGALGRLGLRQPTPSTMVVTASRQTSLSPEVIWKAWSNLEAWPRWSKPILQSARWLEGRTWEVGSKFEQTRNLGAPVGRQVTVETVREVNQGQSVSWWEGTGGMKSCHLWFFEPLADGGTMVHETEVFVGFLPLLFKLVMRGRLRNMFQESVDGLIKHAEREPTG